jgi:hypothetical protein
MRLLLLAVSAATALGSGAAQAQDTCSNSQQTVSAVQTTGDDLRGANPLGRSAFACGATWSAAAIFEKALETRPTISARFNLATAYAVTERYQAAAELYQSVVADGQFTTLRLDRSAAGLGRTSIRVNAADEAERRLERLALRTGAASSPASVAPVVNDRDESNGPLGVQARVRAIVDNVHVSGDRALYFDGLAPIPEDLRRFQDGERPAPAPASPAVR